MMMSIKDAQNYKEYADSTDDLIKKCEDIVNNLTPEEANAKCIWYHLSEVTNEENYERFVQHVKDAVKSAKRQTEGMKDYYERYSVPKAYIELEEMKYIYNKICTQTETPPQMDQLIRNTYEEFQYRNNPSLRRKKEEEECRIKQMQEDVKKYTSPDEPTVGYAELMRRKAAANPPQTSLSQDEIRRFDMMSEEWLVRWCHFSYNWYWVVPCLLLCIVANGGLVAAIGLIVFMICGEIYSMRVQEYCGTILPWYRDSGKTLEKRIINKYIKK